MAERARVQGHLEDEEPVRQGVSLLPSSETSSVTHKRSSPAGLATNVIVLKVLLHSCSFLLDVGGRTTTSPRARPHWLGGQRRESV